MTEMVKDETLKSAILKNEQNSYFRFYTKMQLNSLFKMFLAMYKSYEEKNQRLKKSNSNISSECGKIETEKNNLKKTIKYLYLKIKYILDYPERIKIVSIPINGILQQYKKIEKKNNENQIVKDNLKIIFDNIRFKMSFKKDMPVEYSSKKLDNMICDQKKKIKELEAVIKKLTKGSDHDSEQKKSKLLDRILSLLSLNCQSSDDSMENISDDALEKKIQKIQNENSQSDSDLQLDPLSNFLLSLSHNN
jgi:hypothetical protein